MEQFSHSHRKTEGDVKKQMSGGGGGAGESSSNLATHTRDHPSPR